MKNKLFELLEKAHQAEKGFIAELSVAELNGESTLEKWAAKDIIAHNSHWRKHHAENLLAALANESPTATEDIDHANEEVYFQYREQPWEAVEALAKSSYERMTEALNLLGNEGLQRVGFFPWHGDSWLATFIPIPSCICPTGISKRGIRLEQPKCIKK